MRNKWTLPNSYKGMEGNFEVAQDVLDLLEASGLFSFNFMDKFYDSFILITESMNKGDMESVSNIRKSLETMIETYSIFSNEFKNNIKGKIHIICFQKYTTKPY